MFHLTQGFLFPGQKCSKNLRSRCRAQIKFIKELCKYSFFFRLRRLQQIEVLDELFMWSALKYNVKIRRRRFKLVYGLAILDFSTFVVHGFAELCSLLEVIVNITVEQTRRLDSRAIFSFFWLAFWFQWLYPLFLPCLWLAISNRYLMFYGDLSSRKRKRKRKRKRRRFLGITPTWSNLLVRSGFLYKARSFTGLASKSIIFLAVNKSARFFRFGRSRRLIRFLSPQTSVYSHFPRFTVSRRLLFCLLRRRRRRRWWSRWGSRFFFLKNIRARLRALKYAFPRRAIREFRFIRKYKAFFTVRALHTNLFFTIRQGNTYFHATTGMFDDLKRGTKRKRTLMAGWFLADRLFDKVGEALKSKSIFRVNVTGRTSGRRGIWFSWRTKDWRVYEVWSRTPLAFNGTRACLKRRL